jgi:hypothetical protein
MRGVDFTLADLRLKLCHTAFQASNMSRQAIERRCEIIKLIILACEK